MYDLCYSLYIFHNQCRSGKIETNGRQAFCKHAYIFKLTRFPYTCIHVYILCAHAYLCTCTHVPSLHRRTIFCLYFHMYTYKNICIRVYICVHMYSSPHGISIHTYTYIFIYTHMNIYAENSADMCLQKQ